jgi:hypothetical protein
MAWLIIIVLVAALAYIIGVKNQAQVVTSVDQAPRDDLEPNTFFSIVVHYEAIAKDSFVRKAVIPELRRLLGDSAYRSELAMLKKNKHLSSKPDHELRELAWGLVISHLIEKAVKTHSNTGSLRFGLLGTAPSLNQALLWDEASKSLSKMPESGTDLFSLSLVDESATYYLFDDVKLKGRFVLSENGDGKTLVLKVYFYTPGIHGKDVQQVGILCELPYPFLRADRDALLARKAEADQLLDEFALKFNKYYEGHDDWYEDELGETQMSGGNMQIAIGNDLVSIYVD